MNPDNVQKLIRQLEASAGSPPPSPPAPPLNPGGGSGNSDDMEPRVTRLETHMEYVRRDLDELRAGQTEILNVVRGLATKGDLWAWKWQWTALAFAVVAIVIGGIIGGLGWIEPDAAPASPIVVQMPAPQNPPEPSPAPSLSR